MSRGKRFESARRLSLFALDKPNTLIDSGPVAHHRGPPDTTEVDLERRYPAAVHAMGSLDYTAAAGFLLSFLIVEMWFPKSRHRDPKRKVGHS
jgi:hypothetical protein